MDQDASEWVCVCVLDRGELEEGGECPSLCVSPPPKEEDSKRECEGKEGRCGGWPRESTAELKES